MFPQPGMITGTTVTTGATTPHRKSLPRRSVPHSPRQTTVTPRPLARHSLRETAAIPRLPLRHKHPQPAVRQHHKDKVTVMTMAGRSESAGGRRPRCKRLCAALLAALLPALATPPLMAQQAAPAPVAASAGGGSAPAAAVPGSSNAGTAQGQNGQEEDGKNVLESAGGFTTLELATTTVAQLPSCLEYTIEGITLRMIIHPWGVTYFWTPHVSHYSPDLLAMSHRELQYFPYIEYRLLLAIPYYEFTRTVFSRLLATLLGFNTNVPMAGGHYLHDQFGKHQSVQFSDAMVIGHPVAMLIEAFTFKGVNLPEDNSSNRIIIIFSSCGY